MIEYGSVTDWRWNGPLRVIQFTVFHNNETIVCRVSKECITENCGNPQTPEACLDAAKQHSEHITDKVGLLVSAGRFEQSEAQKTVLLRSSDW